MDVFGPDPLHLAIEILHAYDWFGVIRIRVRLVSFGSSE